MATGGTQRRLLDEVAHGVDTVVAGRVELVHRNARASQPSTSDASADTSGSGAVATQSFAALRAHDAGARFTSDRGRTFPWRGRGLVIPTFDEVVEALPSTLPLIVELKTPAASAALHAAITRHGIQKRVIVAGFESASTQPLRGQGFALGASTADVVRPLLPSLLRRPIPTPPSARPCCRCLSSMSPAEIGRAHV